MSMFHGTISRRDYMKYLGLVGVGATALSAPIFHDLDELISSDTGGRHPWFVKEVDVPTQEIDWDMLQPCLSNIGANSAGKADAENYHDTSYGFKAGYWQELYDRAARNKTEWMKAGKPGYTVKDWALRAGVTAPPGATYPWVVAHNQPSLGQLEELPEGIQNANNPTGIPTEGVPKYTGTPEENSKMVRAARHFYGIDVVGFTVLDAHMKQMVYRDKYDWENVPMGYVNSKKRNVIPTSKQMYVTMGFYQESNGMWQTAPSVTAKTAHYVGNRQMSIEASSTHRFINALQYDSLHGGGGFGATPGWGSLAGMNEVGRPGNSLNPEYGMASAGSAGMIMTDLPLAPTKPIDAGVERFCETCNRCTECCPGGAILGEPKSWDTKGPWSNPGHKAFQNNMNVCRDSFFLNYACLMCTANCVFTKHDAASIHEIVKGVVANTPIFNSFFTNMDRAFGYGTSQCDATHNPDQTGDFNQKAADWWDLDLPRFALFKAKI